MITYAIETNKYDVDLPVLLSRRLSQCGLRCGLGSSGNAATVTVQEESSLPLLAEALTMLLCRDLMYFEMARFADALPLELTEKQAVLTDTLRLARETEASVQICDNLLRYLSGHRRLNLEGYVQFRMRECLDDWRGIVEQVAAEQSLRREYAALMGTLRGFVQSQQPRAGEMSVCLHPDGSCTLTDDSDARIEYVDCSEDGVVALLVSMAPSFLTVYDLSDGKSGSLADTIRHVFAGRVKVFR